jgi:predicted transcriptional regulator
MELSPYIDGLRRELGNLTRLAPSDVTKVVDSLAAALDSSVRLMLLDVIAATAAEITSRLDGTVIDVRISAGAPEFVVTAVPPPPDASAGYPAGGAAEDSATARLTVRLPDALKARVEARAAAEGLSVNAWLVQATIKAVDDAGQPGRRRSGPGIGQRITGYARS